MGAVELDSQGIERRDFPIVRRGYDPASVDAHLRALAADVEELQREASSRGRESLASTAGTQVQGILEAAQATAETIERGAAQDAQGVRDAANADARRTREEAVARAQEHVAAVSQATEVLLARVGTIDGETRALVESLRAGAGRLAGDLARVEAEMGALYDAAAGRAGGGEGLEEAKVQVAIESTATDAAAGPEEAVIAPVWQASVDDVASAANEPEPNSNGGPHPVAALPAVEHSTEPPAAHPTDALAVPTREDLDGARLVALNMALNGDSREETGRYLAENFDVPDRERLLDEVYAAIEG
jgi:DivIVA domain-containing protein